MACQAKTNRCLRHIFVVYIEAATKSQSTALSSRCEVNYYTRNCSSGGTERGGGQQEGEKRAHRTKKGTTEASSGLSLPRPRKGLTRSRTRKPLMNTNKHGGARKAQLG